MHRSALAAIALCASFATAGCSLREYGLPEFPLGVPDQPLRGSIKDDVPKPAKPAKVGIKSITVEGVHKEAAAGIINAMGAELVTAGYVLNQPGHTIKAVVAPADTGIRITWGVMDASGKLLGTVEQSNNVLPRVLEPGANTHAVVVAKAALPGLMKHLPPPK